MNIKTRQSSVFQADMLAFFDAAKTGDVKKVNKILREIPAAKKWRDTENNDRTGLMYAAENGHLAVAMALTMVADADVDAKNQRGSTALMFACRGNYGALASHLIDVGADPNATNLDQSTALLVAAWEGHTDICKMLVKRGAKIDAQDGELHSALMLAAMNGKEETCLALLDMGAQKSLKEINNKTAAQLASEAGFPQLAKAIENHVTAAPAARKPSESSLSKAFANASTPSAYSDSGNGYEKSPAKASLIVDERRLEEELKERILKSASAGNFEFVFNEIEKNKSLVHTVNGNGSTLLMFACMKGTVDDVKTLLDFGANVNALNNNLTTALMVASSEGKVDAVRALLYAGADKTLKDIDGLSADGFADQNGHEDLGDALRNYVQKISPKVAPAPTPQEIAAAEKKELFANALKGDFTAVLAYLEQHNDLVNAANERGSTILMIAAKTGTPQDIEKLVELGADVNGSNVNRTTALMVGASEGKGDNCNKLLELGADKNLKDNIGAGTTAVDYANNNNFKELAETIRNYDPKKEETIDEMLQGLREAQEAAVEQINRPQPAPKPNKALGSLTERLKRGGLTD